MRAWKHASAYTDKELGGHSYHNRWIGEVQKASPWLPRCRRSAPLLLYPPSCLSKLSTGKRFHRRHVLTVGGRCPRSFGTLCPVGVTESFVRTTSVVQPPAAACCGVHTLQVSRPFTRTPQDAASQPQEIFPLSPYRWAGVTLPGKALRDARLRSLGAARAAKSPLTPSNHERAASQAVPAGSRLFTF